MLGAHIGAYPAWRPGIPATWTARRGLGLAVEAAADACARQHHSSTPIKRGPGGRIVSGAESPAPAGRLVQRVQLGEATPPTPSHQSERGNARGSARSTNREAAGAGLEGQVQGGSGVWSGWKLCRGEGESATLCMKEKPPQKPQSGGTGTPPTPRVGGMA